MDQEIKNQLDRLEQKLDMIIKWFNIQEKPDLSQREIDAIANDIIQKALYGKKK